MSDSFSFSPARSLARPPAACAPLRLNFNLLEVKWKFSPAKCELRHHSIVAGPPNGEQSRPARRG